MPVTSQLTMFTDTHRQAQHIGPSSEPWSPAFASMATPLWVSGLVMALVVAGVQLANNGFHASFASEFVENWLVVWALAFPVFYMASGSLHRAAAYVGDLEEAAAVAVASCDIAALTANPGKRPVFSVLRNLKVREAFYRA